MLPDLGILLIRMLLGIVMSVHGTQRVLGWIGGYGLTETGAFFEELGFRPGVRFAAAVGMSELSGGILLTLGLFTPFGAAAILMSMLLAIASVQLKYRLFTITPEIELPGHLPTTPGGTHRDRELYRRCFRVIAATTVVVSSENGLAQKIIPGDHRWRADEPAPFGTDTGPSPYELLLSSLGACTSMTLWLYAQGKGMDLQGITIRLQYFRIHAEDCRDCETKQGFLDRIDCEIELSGHLDEAQKRRLLEIAERCPIHRTLKSEMDIQTSIL